MNLHVLAGPNFSGRTARLRKWVGLPDDLMTEPVYSRSAYIGPDAASSLSGIAPTTGAEIELMAKDCEAAAAAKSAMESLGFGYCLTQNPFTLSGGEQVVAAIVAASAACPERLAIDSALEQLSPGTRGRVLDYLGELDGDLMIADNRLREWFEGPVEDLLAIPGTPTICTDIPFTINADPCQIELIDLCHSYVKGRPVLRNLNFTLEAGQHYLLRGPNGSGKTTLSKILCGLIKPSSGEIRLNGVVVKPWLAPGRFLSYHFQNPDYQLFAASVRAQFGPHAADKFVRQYGLAGVLDEHPLDLPYVLKKRVAVASTLARGTGAVILDEPSIGQDASFQDTLVRSRIGATCVTISHSQSFECLPIISLP